jgi:hypothetical protein
MFGRQKTALCEKLSLVRRFDSLGNHRQSQRAPQRNDGLRNHSAGLVRTDIPHKRAIDLQLVERRPVQIGKRGIPRPKVIQRYLDPVLLQDLHLLDHVFEIFHQH